MKKIYLIVGTPGSGKTWVCNQLTDKFDYLPHDDFPNAKAYVSAIARLLSFNDKSILVETPFSVSKILEPLINMGFSVIPVFIIEHPDIVRKRYENRENKEIPIGHITRITTYIERAKSLGAFSGTSQEVLNYLKSI